MNEIAINQAKKEIDWNDFENWFLEMAAGSSDSNPRPDEMSDKKFFVLKAIECENKIMTESLKQWYDNRNYRGQSE